MDILDRTDSTSLELRRRLQDGPLPHGFTLLAREQTAGHGRLGRAWQCPPGAGLLCSVWLQLHQPTAQAVGFSLVPPLAVLDLLDMLDMPDMPDSLTSPDALEGDASFPDPAQRLAAPAMRRPSSGRVTPWGCKWPNDIRVRSPQGPRKLCGILTECCSGPATPPSGLRNGGQAGLRVEGLRVDGVIVGVGLNVLAAPPCGEPPAIALCEVLPEPPDLVTLATLLRAALLRRTREWLEDGREALFARWLDRCDHRDALVRVTLDGVKVTGRTRGLGPMGQLLLDVDGHVREVWAEDISA